MRDLKILKNGEQFGILNEESHEVKIGSEAIRLPPNIIISSGDTLVIRGREYDVLEYNPTFFPVVAKRGAQVIQPKDVAYLLAKCAIKPGSRVLESGIGSGALSSALLWAIGPAGKLYSYDLDSESVEMGKRNVELFQDTDNWITSTGDVRSTDLPGNIDSVILDVPDPWDALSNVGPSLKNGGILAAYSPTYNQTEKTVFAMSANSISHLETSEIIKRDILVRSEATRPDHRMLGHTAFITIGTKRSGHSVKI